MKLAPIALLLALAAAGCASPAPEFMGAKGQPVSIEGIDFVVYRKGDEAEVIRMGYLPRAARARVPGLMPRAAEAATGCRAVPGSLQSRLPGDPGEGRVRLAC